MSSTTLLEVAPPHQDQKGPPPPPGGAPPPNYDDLELRTTIISSLEKLLDDTPPTECGLGGVKVAPKDNATLPVICAEAGSAPPQEARQQHMISTTTTAADTAPLGAAAGLYYNYDSAMPVFEQTNRNKHVFVAEAGSSYHNNGAGGGPSWSASVCDGPRPPGQPYPTGLGGPRPPGMLLPPRHFPPQHFYPPARHSPSSGLIEALEAVIDRDSPDATLESISVEAIGGGKHDLRKLDGGNGGRGGGGLPAAGEEDQDFRFSTPELLGRGSSTTTGGTGSPRNSGSSTDLGSSSRGFDWGSSSSRIGSAGSVAGELKELFHHVI